MNREQIVDAGIRAALQVRGPGKHRGVGREVRAVLDAILPQVSTVEELEALPFDAKVVDAQGEAWAHYYLATKSPRPLRWRNSRGNYGVTSGRLIAMGCGPLTVVWRPES